MITTEANEWVSFYFLYLSFWTTFTFRFNCVTFLLVWNYLFDNLIQDQHFKSGTLIQGINKQNLSGKSLRWKSGGRDVRDKISYHTWHGYRLCNRTLYHKILSYYLTIYATIVGRKISVWKFFVLNFVVTFSILMKKNKTWPGVLTENVPFRFPLFEENVKEAKLGLCKWRYASTRSSGSDQYSSINMKICIILSILFPSHPLLSLRSGAKTWSQTPSQRWHASCLSDLWPSKDIMGAALLQPDSGRWASHLWRAPTFGRWASKALPLPDELLELYLWKMGL